MFDRDENSTPARGPLTAPQPTIILSLAADGARAPLAASRMTGRHPAAAAAAVRTRCACIRSRGFGLWRYFCLRTASIFLLP